MMVYILSDQPKEEFKKFNIELTRPKSFAKKPMNMREMFIGEIEKEHKGYFMV